MKKAKNNKYTVFFDFDNTITTRDVFDSMLIRFAKDDSWVDLEKKWNRGEIGSLECLRGQVNLMRATKRQLERYLDTVKVDPYFKKVVKLLEANGAKVIILSDNFDYILDYIIKKNKLPDLKIYANRMKIKKDRLIPSFPYAEHSCGKCAHCKKTNLLSQVEKGSKTVYVGDGLSDICASTNVDIVFAKSYLKKHFKDNKIAHVPFDNLKGVYDYFKKRLK